MPPSQLNLSYPASSTIILNIANSANDISDNYDGGGGGLGGGGGGNLGLGYYEDENSLVMQQEWMLPMLEDQQTQRTFANSPTTETLLILGFSFFISFGALGNGLVCFVVARNPHMRTPRNIFIINLAISDFTLCVFTQPLNLYLLIKTQWELGSFMCKFVTMFQGTNLFVSTISITAIALDRFQVIVYPTRESMKQVGAAIGLLSVWIISFLMASPALLFQRLDVLHPFEKEFPEFKLCNCIEDENMKVEKRAYTVAQMVVQYFLPFIILTVAHLRICNKLRYRMVNQQQQQQQQLKARNTARTQQQQQQQRSSQQERRSRRKRKTNLLLATIAMVFALSWLPLNIFNLLSEFHGELFHSGFNRTTAEGTMTPGGGAGRMMNIDMAYAICHLLVLCSACVNPVVYGWFNDNFKSEFLKILCCPCCKAMRAALRNKLHLLLCCCCKQTGAGQRCCRGASATAAAGKPGVPAITLTKAKGSHNGSCTGFGGPDSCGEDGMGGDLDRMDSGVGRSCSRENNHRANSFVDDNGVDRNGSKDVQLKASCSANGDDSGVARSCSRENNLKASCSTNGDDSGVARSCSRENNLKASLIADDAGNTTTGSVSLMPAVTRLS